MNRIDVTCALVIKNGKLLACQRGAESFHPFEWEFPGGKVEAGETPQECIVRELQEELGLAVEISKELEAIEHDYPWNRIRLIPFLCKVTDDEPIINEHHAIRWIKPADFEKLKWSAADFRLFKLNRKHIV